MADTDTATDTEMRTVEIVFDAQARTLGKMQNEVTVTSRFSNLTVTLQTDEGKLHGGTGAAPMPIHYFAAGVVTCLMTQMKAFAKRLRIPLDDIRMTAVFHWQLQQQGRDPYVAEPVGFTIDIDPVSGASTEDMKRLVAAAKEGCFAEKALTRAVPIAHRLKVGDDWIDV
jgi:uncharacterized OsmC-like protein